MQFTPSETRFTTRLILSRPTQAGTTFSIAANRQRCQVLSCSTVGTGSKSPQMTTSLKSRQEFAHSVSAATQASTTGSSAMPSCADGTIFMIIRTNAWDSYRSQAQLSPIQSWRRQYRLSSFPWSMSSTGSEFLAWTRTRSSHLSSYLGAAPAAAFFTSFISATVQCSRRRVQAV